MEITTENPIKLKDGSTIPAGVPLVWHGLGAVVEWHGRKTKISTLGAARALDISIPSDEDLDHWVCDSVCESIMGEMVEPDGHDEHGSPSWLLALGLI